MGLRAAPLAFPFPVPDPFPLPAMGSSIVGPPWSRVTEARRIVLPQRSGVAVLPHDGYVRSVTSRCESAGRETAVRPTYVSVERLGSSWR
jgi:hypothetical protein